MVIVKKRQASSTLYFILFFIIFLAFCAFAVDGTIVFTNRAKLQSITETAALAGAEQFNSDNDPLTVNPSERASAEAVAQATFDLLKQGGLKTATASAVADTTTKLQVTLNARMVAQPFFLSFLGVSGINLSAQAIAVSQQERVFGNVDPRGIHWLTKRAPYKRDVIEDDSIVLKPLGDFTSLSFPSGNVVNYSLISSEDSQPLSLGSGGFVTIKLPVPIINKEGPDLQIAEIGNREGYMVFAGLDKDPNNPYINHTDNVGSVSWVNISCAGDASMQQRTAATKLTGGPQVKVYGSGNFDLDANCLNGNVNMVKYIRIIDDNEESAYINGALVYPYGESSSKTPGADIDYVKVLNYVHLTQ